VIIINQFKIILHQIQFKTYIISPLVTGSCDPQIHAESLSNILNFDLPIMIISSLIHHDIWCGSHHTGLGLMRLRSSTLWLIASDQLTAAAFFY